MEGLAPLLIGFGFVLTFIGYIRVVIEAFSAGLLWGLGVLIFPPVLVIFALTHWNNVKGSIMMYFAGWGMLLLVMSQ